MKKWLTAIIMFASAATCSAAEMKDDGSINIYFARHGKTLLNTFDRVQGWADSPLTKAAGFNASCSTRVDIIFLRQINRSTRVELKDERVRIAKAITYNRQLLQKMMPRTRYSERKKAS